MNIGQEKNIDSYGQIFEAIEKDAQDFDVLGKLTVGQSVRESKITGRLKSQSQENVLWKGTRKVLALTNPKMAELYESEAQPLELIFLRISSAAQNIEILKNKISDISPKDIYIYQSAFKALKKLQVSFESFADGFTALANTYKGRLYRSESVPAIFESKASWMNDGVIPALEDTLKLIIEVWREQEEKVIDVQIGAKKSRERAIYSEAFEELTLKEDQLDSSFVEMWIDSDAEKKIEEAQKQFNTDSEESGPNFLRQKNYIREIYRGIKNNIALSPISEASSILMPHQFLLDIGRTDSLKLNGKDVIDQQYLDGSGLSSEKIVQVLIASLSEGRSDEEGMRLCQHIGRIFSQTLALNQSAFAFLLASSSENAHLGGRGLGMHWKIDVTSENIKMTLSQGFKLMSLEKGWNPYDISVPFLCAKTRLEIPVSDLLKEDAWDQIGADATKEQKEKASVQDQSEEVLPGLKITNDFSRPLFSEDTVSKILSEW